MKKLEKEKIILGYNTMIDWEKYGDDSVSAMIESMLLHSVNLVLMLSPKEFIVLMK